jgi:hypothetical protein
MVMMTVSVGVQYAGGNVFMISSNRLITVMNESMPKEEQITANVGT